MLLLRMLLLPLLLLLLVFIRKGGVGYARRSVTAERRA